jgi:hypothetical protein
LNWLAWIGVLLLVALSFLPTVIIFLEFISYPSRSYGWYGRTPWQEVGFSMNIWQLRVAGTLVACVLLIAVAVRAATCVSSERDRQTLDGLLTSPLDSTEILFAKCLGNVLSVRFAMLWLLAIWGIGVLTGGLHILALPLVAAAWLIFAAFLSVMGTWFSMVSKTTLRATVWTLLCTAVLGGAHLVVWMCCGPLLFLGGPGDGRAAEFLIKFHLGLTPPFALGFLQFHGEEFRGPYAGTEAGQFMAACLFGLFIWALGTVIFFVGANARFRALTNRLPHMEPEFAGYQPGAWEAPRRRRPPRVEAIPEALPDDDPDEEDGRYRRGRR